jgi:hypothetical protein
MPFKLLKEGTRFRPTPMLSTLWRKECGSFDWRHSNHFEVVILLKATPVPKQYALKAYRRHDGTAPSILCFSSRRQVFTFMLWQLYTWGNTPWYPTWWAPEPSGYKNNHPTPRHVTLLNKLVWLMPVLRFTQDTPFPTLTLQHTFVKDWLKLWQKKSNHHFNSVRYRQ